MKIRKISQQILAVMMIFVLAAPFATEVQAGQTMSGRHAYVGASSDIHISAITTPKNTQRRKERDRDRTPVTRPVAVKYRPSPVLSRRYMQMSNKSTGYTVTVYNAGSAHWSVRSGASHVSVRSGRSGKSFTLRPTSNGSGTISCKAGGRTLTCSFNVSLPNPNNAYLSDKTLYMDQSSSYSLKVGKTGSRAVRWSVTSGGANVRVTGSYTGKKLTLKPVKAGSGTIRCRVGSKNLSCKFEVSSSPKLNKTEVKLKGGQSVRLSVSKYLSENAGRIRWKVGDSAGCDRNCVKISPKGAACTVKANESGAGWVECDVDGRQLYCLVTVDIRNDATIDADDDFEMTDPSANYIIDVAGYNDSDIDKISWSISSGASHVEVIGSTNGTSLTLRPVSAGKGTVKCRVAKKVMKCTFVVRLANTSFSDLQTYIDGNGSYSEDGGNQISDTDLEGYDDTYYTGVWLTNSDDRIVMECELKDTDINDEGETPYHSISFELDGSGKVHSFRASAGVYEDEYEYDRTERFGITADDFSADSFTGASVNFGADLSLGNGMTQSSANSEANRFLMRELEALNSYLKDRTDISLDDLGFSLPELS